MLDEFREAMKSQKPYYLCLGNCYIITIKNEYSKLLDRPAYYVNFQGASDKGLYCYSLLENCRGVFLFSAWANIASVATTKYFNHWRKILDELLMIGCPVVIVEAPMSQKHYRHPDTGNGITVEELEKRRERYIKEVIDTAMCPNLIFKDMAAIVGYDSKHLIDQQPTKAPWHLNNITIKKATRYFTKVIVSGKGDLF